MQIQTLQSTANTLSAEQCQQLKGGTNTSTETIIITDDPDVW